MANPECHGDGETADRDDPHHDQARSNTIGKPAHCQASADCCRLHDGEDRASTRQTVAEMSDEKGHQEGVPTALGYGQESAAEGEREKTGNQQERPDGPGQIFGRQKCADA